MPEPRLTPQQGYAAMTLFLEGHYRRTGSDDIGGLPEHRAKKWEPVFRKGDATTDK
jgi:hypothetical protein